MVDLDTGYVGEARQMWQELAPGQSELVEKHIQKAWDIPILEIKHLLNKITDINEKACFLAVFNKDSGAHLHAIPATTLGIVLCNGANILYIIPFTAKSHYIMLRPIGLELARRGHNVTVITTFKETDHPPNYHQVLADDIKIWDALGIPKPNVFSMTNMTSVDFHKKILWTGGVAVTEIALKSKNVQNFLKKEHSFDLVINELFFQEAFYILSHKYNAPHVLVTTYGNNMRNNIMLRNPWQISTVLQEYISVQHPTSFFGRMKNLCFSLYDLIFWRYWYLEQQEQLVKKYLPNLSEPVPSLVELQQKASLVLMNSHFSVDRPIAYLPNFVEVGGLHLQDSKNALPDDLQNILDNAKYGVVYVSFGSNVQSSELPIEKKNAFLNVFRKLKQTVIWKWEEPTMENKPDNVILRQWLPQKEILAHPNVKVFIAHGGKIGVQEAIFNGVPIIGMPIYADQFNNLLQIQDDGHGKLIEYDDLNEINLQNVLDEVLKTDAYKKKAKEIAARFKDRPMKPIDAAMFWIEYVIRHKGADFAKNPALKMSYLESSMIDVYAVILIILASVLLLIQKFINVISNVFKSKPNVTKSKNLRKKKDK